MLKLPNKSDSQAVTGVAIESACVLIDPVTKKEIPTVPWVAKELLQQGWVEKKSLQTEKKEI